MSQKYLFAGLYIRLNYIYLNIFVSTDNCFQFLNLIFSHRTLCNFLHPEYRQKRDSLASRVAANICNILRAVATRFSANVTWPPPSARFFNCSLRAYLTPFVFTRARVPCKTSRVCARARVSLRNPAWGCDFTAARFPAAASSRDSGTTDNVFPAGVAVKSLEIQVYPSRRARVPRGHRSYSRTRTRAYK